MNIEEIVLGSLLIAPDLINAIEVKESYFAEPKHKLIFRHISRLAEQAKPIDVITVAQSLESTGKAEMAGGLEYLGQLVQNVPSVTNIGHYAKILQSEAKKTEFQSAVSQILELSIGNLETSDKIEKSIEILTSLSEDDSNGPIRLQEALSGALELVEYRYTAKNEISGLKTHIEAFDNKTSGLQAGDLIILAARPSMGKTALAMNIAENVAIDGKTVLVFSLEMSKEQLATRAIASVGGISMNGLRTGRIHDDDWSRMTHAIGKLNDANMFIDQSALITAGQMFSRARKIKRQHGLDLIVIDYLQLMAGEGSTRNEELSATTRKLKLMAKDFGVPVLCLSQLSRKVEERTNKRPLLSDLRDSGAIEQDADVIIMLYRDDYYNPDSQNKGLAEAIIGKHRMGETGTVVLKFEGEFSRFKSFEGRYDYAAKPDRKSIAGGL